jgi:DNA invertase Pin-like site-specific DNA recombinase
MLIGYARVSTGEQNLDLQTDDLKRAGCEQIFSDEISGAKAERPALREALAFARSEDAIVVWRLDRLGRSLKDLVQNVEDLNARGVQFRSLHENIDTTSPGGKFQFHVFSALAEFERDLIRERTMADHASTTTQANVAAKVDIGQQLTCPTCGQPMAHVGHLPRTGRTAPVRVRSPPESVKK